MIILSMLIFAFCTWATFTHRFCDGIITKHFLAFSAITAVLVIKDSSNVSALLASIGLLFAGLGYWLFKHWAVIRKALQLIIH